MRLITENRHDLLESLKEIDTRKIISFGMPDIEHLKDKPLMVIVNTAQLGNYKKSLPDKWYIKKNNKIHSKLALGKEGFVIGSWNFTDNSTNNMHESVLVVPYNENPLMQKLLADYFEVLWNRSSEVKRGI